MACQRKERNKSLHHYISPMTYPCQVLDDLQTLTKERRVRLRTARFFLRPFTSSPFSPLPSSRPSGSALVSRLPLPPSIPDAPPLPLVSCPHPQKLPAGLRVTHALTREQIKETLQSNLPHSKPWLCLCTPASGRLSSPPTRGDLSNSCAPIATAGQLARSFV